MIFDYILLVIVFIGPTIAILDPIMPYLCGKPPDYKNTKVMNFYLDQAKSVVEDSETISEVAENVDDVLRISGTIEKDFKKGVSPGSGSNQGFQEAKGDVETGSLPPSQPHRVSQAKGTSISHPRMRPQKSFQERIQDETKADKARQQMHDKELNQRWQAAGLSPEDDYAMSIHRRGAAEEKSDSK